MRHIAFIFLCFSYSIVNAQATVNNQQNQHVISFVSDTQEPLQLEKLWHRTDNNIVATQMLFKDISALHPQALFILGDVVSLGKSDKAWKNIDKYLAQMVHNFIPVYATLGNHEVMFNVKKGTKNFKDRFPDYQAKGYAVVIDSVAIVLLNSNFATMKPAEVVEQNNWYKNELKALDEEKAVKLIIVSCHHSPFTNSKVVHPSTQVQKNFLPPFIASAKCVLFLSGHSHNYEHFKVQDKHFVVIGGGGGLHQGLKPNNDVMYDITAGYKPAFHYLEVRRKNDSLEVSSRQLKQDFSGFANSADFIAK